VIRGPLAGKGLSRSQTTVNVLDIVLSAEPGFDVLLYEFSLAGLGDTLVNAVQVFDGVPFPFLTPTNFLSQTLSVTAPGSGHLLFDFTVSPLQTPTIWIRIDANNLGADSINVAVDNIRFGQADNPDSQGGLDPEEIDDAFTSSEVPEPATLTLMLTGGAALAARRVRRRRRQS
jgi:hypothetical protein